MTSCRPGMFDTRICRAMLIQAGVIVGALVGIAGIVVGVLRLFD